MPPVHSLSSRRWLFIPLVLILAIGTFLLSVNQTGRHPSNMTTSSLNTASTFVEEQLKAGKRPNRLINEKSPYLLQHAFNPVDWYPWGNEAFAKARNEDRPIFLSVGYSTCYWCHVMEREDFENPEIAKFMSDHFVCIKLDREERPDIDHVYMMAVQAIAGGGGWPMSVFLTPDLKPFFGGTYFPPTPQMGRPGFLQILQHISGLWTSDRAKVVESGNQIALFIAEQNRPDQSFAPKSTLPEKAFQQFERSFDSSYGGFGSAPKFPQPVTLNFLLQFYARTGSEPALRMTLTTLRAMTAGGIYDHLAGGFHRYSTDREWRVPHFEKMLYDQGQLASLYLDAFQITHDEEFAETARQVLDYVLREMTSPSGGFYSAQDAESIPPSTSPSDTAGRITKREGAYYLWTTSEIEKSLGKHDAEVFGYFYGVLDAGNAAHDPGNMFAGKNILYIAHSIAATSEKFNLSAEQVIALLDRSRKRLAESRESRPKPHLDDKVITAWNGLMVSAFAKGSQVLGDRKYLDAAVHSAAFLRSTLYDEQRQRLCRRYRDGEARFEGTLRDYAFLARGMQDLYEATFDDRWMEFATELTKAQIVLFRDSTNGGFFDTPAGDGTLLIRSKEDYDGAEPTGNSVAALNLFRLSHMLNNAEWKLLAEGTVAAFGSRMERFPQSLAHMVLAYDVSLSPPTEIVIAGSPEDSDVRKLLAEVYRHYIPNRVLIMKAENDSQHYPPGIPPYLAGKSKIDGKAAAYLCENFSCRLPTTDPAELGRLLAQRSPLLR